MDILYPRIGLRDLMALVATVLAGACIAGFYGALHDQVSYWISPEYFTRMKFAQFGVLRLAKDTPRVAAGDVGFLATWWVGAIGGWLIGRAGRPSQWRVSLRALGLCVLVVLVAGVTGALLGMLRVQGELASWSEWREGLGIRDLESFVIVAYIHDAGYAGALLGIVAAMVYVMHARRRDRRAE